jgi:hypothetical protein
MFCLLILFETTANGVIQLKLYGGLININGGFGGQVVSALAFHL